MSGIALLALVAFAGVFIVCFVGVLRRLDDLEIRHEMAREAHWDLHKLVRENSYQMRQLFSDLGYEWQGRQDPQWVKKAK